MRPDYGGTHMGLSIGIAYAGGRLQCMETMGERIKSRRKELGLTQAQLAKLVHLDQSSVSDIERKGVVPSAETLYAIATAVERSVDYLLTGVDNAAWPFALVDRARYERLTAEQRGYVQKAMNAALDECEQAGRNVTTLRPANAGSGQRQISSPFSATSHPARRAGDKAK
jgi:transcriptional regulator with XRE-family HTH domain